MPYTNCAICGAKALVGATRCPRCEAPFVSYAEPGKRVPTVNCPRCGVQRPVAIGVCPNCFTSASHSSVRVSRGLILTGIAIVGIITIGYFVSRTVPRTGSVSAVALAADTVADRDSLPAAGVARDSAVRDSAALDSAALETVAPKPAGTAPPPVPAPSTAAGKNDPLKPAPHPISAVSDTGAWDNAVANTWVRVRTAPSRGSGVLRMIDSAQRVQLGPSVYGWRPVRVGADRGWVDPRLFTVTSPVRP